MNNRRTKLLFKIILSQLGFALFVSALAASILFYAEGYRLNYRNFKITKIGILAVTSTPKDAEVFLNGKLANPRTPHSFNLLPGYYSFSLAKNGYAPWSQSVRVESELVKDFKEVVLFKVDPKISIVTDQRIINSLNSPMDDLAIKNTKGLYHSEYEIWVESDLVTRFSSPIYNVIWYPDRSHVIYQQGKEIRVIETLGTNDTLLVKLNQDSQASFKTSSRGDTLYYEDGGEYKMAEIR